MNPENDDADDNGAEARLRPEARRERREIVFREIVGGGAAARHAESERPKRARLEADSR